MNGVLVERRGDPGWRVWSSGGALSLAATVVREIFASVSLRIPTPLSPLLLLHDDRHARRTDTFFEAARRRSSQAVRCPLCQWRPTAASEWLCDPSGTPEPPFQACGTVWNTFATRGRCPGCGHQWWWTTCHRCGVCSPHDEWYDVTDSGDDV